MSPTNFTSYKAALDNSTNTPARPGRVRTRTAKGAFYDQELATETQVAKAKTARRGPAVITKAKPSLNNGHSDALADFAPPLEDPFEDTPIVLIPKPLNKTIAQPTDAQPTENLTFKSVIVHPPPKPRPVNKKTTSNQVEAPESVFSSVSNDLLMTTIIQPPKPTAPHPPSLSVLKRKHTSNNHEEVHLCNDLPSQPPPHPRKRVKASDVPFHLKGLLKLAVADYRSVLATECPFPSCTEGYAHAQAVLTRSSKQLRVSIEDEASYDVLVNLIIPRDSHMRGELRTKLIPLVTSVYGFDPDTAKVTAVQKNRQLCKILKEKDAFLFQDFNCRQGLYNNPILQLAINHMWFCNLRDEGVQFSAYFNPVPLKTIALVFTTVEYIIDQWTTGVYSNKTSFTAKEYHSIFERHLRSLEATQEYSITASNKLLRIQKHLYSRACKAAGVKSKMDLDILDDEDIAVFEQDDDVKDQESDESTEDNKENEYNREHDYSIELDDEGIEG